MRIPNIRTVAAVVLTLAISAGCAATRHIADIQRYPGRYDDRTVSINGVVTSSWSVPLVPFRFYRVEDGTGEITVLSRGARVPIQGARVKVRGRVNQVGTFGGRSVGLHLEQESIKIRRGD